ncbi:hypothetical protein CW736_13615 [Nonlabens sp. MB-3u-79]|nr:hypothetical protein CW736_13615 [Nonlabens sp. MB-3u-79]
MAQVGINTTTPDPSSMLDIQSTDKGLLIPRMTLVERGNIPNPSQGLMVYQTDNTPGFYYFNGSTWNAIAVAEADKWTFDGNNMYNANSSNVGIGTTAPDELLHVSGTSVGTGAHLGNLFAGVWETNSAYAVITHNDVKFDTNGYALIQRNDGTTFLNSVAGKKLGLRIGNSEKITILSDGKVGIGTTAPTAKLEVNGTLVVGNITDNADVSMIMQNNWVTYSNGWSFPEYYKDKLGRVHLQGLIKNGTLGNYATILPAGYRPIRSRIFTVETKGGERCRVDVRYSGGVFISQGCDNDWVSLEGISFRAER